MKLRKIYNIEKDEKGELVADPHNIMARWRNYFSQPFNVHGVKDVGLAEIHTAEPLVPEPSSCEGAGYRQTKKSQIARY